MEENTEKWCHKQQVRNKHINPTDSGFIYTYTHEYNDSNYDLKEEVSLTELINFLYTKIKILENGD